MFFFLGLFEGMKKRSPPIEDPGKQDRPKEQPSPSYVDKVAKIAGSSKILFFFYYMIRKLL